MRLFQSQNRINALGQENPSTLSYTKVYQERFVTPIDNSFIHYTSDFASSVSNLSAVTGASPSISGGNLVVSDTTLMKSTTTAGKSWMCCEMTISSMSTTGASQKLGPAIVKDSSNYICGLYDSVGQTVSIIENGTQRAAANYTLNTTNCKLWIILTRFSISFWGQPSGGALKLLLLYDTSIAYDGLTTMDTYYYGVRSVQSTAANHNVSSLRGGLPGTFGTLNTRVVVDENGAPYYRSGKLILTADLVAPTTNSAGYNAANSALLEMDVDTYELNIIGRYFFKRNSKILGGQDIKIQYRADEAKWMMTYARVDDILNGFENDVYILMTEAEMLDETVFEDTRYNAFGIADANAYDYSSRLIGGTWYVLAADGWGERAIAKLYTGSSLSSLTLADSYDDGVRFFELTSFARFNDTWYYLYTGFDYLKVAVLSHPNMDFVGNIDYPTFVANSRIGGSDWWVKQSGGVSEYYLICFDNQTAVFTDATGNQIPFTNAVGNHAIWKATETRTGLEF